MAQISPYLVFDGNTREVMNFYQSCFGGDLGIQTVAESPVAGEMADDVQDKILHAGLVTSSGFSLMASDMSSENLINGNNVSLTLLCTSEEEINELFKKLSVDAQATRPLKTEFWGAIYGEITDKYGIKWVLNYDKNQQKTPEESVLV